MTRKLLNKPYKGQKCAVSGSGNVAQYCCEKLLDFQAKPVSFSDSRGCIYVKDGVSRELLAAVMDLKNNKRAPLSKFDELHKAGGVSWASFGAVYHDGKKPWEVCPEVDCAFPCACENEINKEEAQLLVSKGLKLVSEGANMPSTNGAIEVYMGHGVMYGPGKAANAGGVAVLVLNYIYRRTELISGESRW